MTSYDPDQYPQQGGAQPYGSQDGYPQYPAQSSTDYGYGQQDPTAQQPYPQQAVAGYGQPAYGPNPATLKNSLGTWALSLGILSLFCCGFFTGIPAIVVGKKGMDAANQGLASNRGQAQAGMIIGIVGCVLSTIGLIVRLLALGNS